MSLCERIETVRPSEFEEIQDEFVDASIRAFFRGLREKGILPDEYTPDVVDAAFTARLAAEDGEVDPHVWFRDLPLNAKQREEARQSEVVSLGFQFHKMLLAVVNADTHNARTVEIAELVAFVDNTLGWTEETLVLLFEQVHRNDHVPVASMLHDAYTEDADVEQLPASLQRRILANTASAADLPSPALRVVSTQE